MDTQSISDYYEFCENDYRWLWDLDRSLALHLGFWDDSTRNLTDALKRENEVLAELAGVQAGDHVLDAGCGVGGSAIFLASRYGCKVTGITICAKQVESAVDNARQRQLVETPTFLLRDYTKTELPSASFDVVWAIESICHARDKAEFIREAYRLLKPGGRLIVADGFSEHSVEPDMSIWLQGWGVSELESVDNFSRYLCEAGFESVAYQDATERVMPSLKRLYRLFFPVYAISKCGEWLGRRTPRQTANVRSAYYIYTTVRRKLWQYGIFTARK